MNGIFLDILLSIYNQIINSAYFKNVENKISSALFPLAPNRKRKSFEIEMLI